MVCSFFNLQIELYSIVCSSLMCCVFFLNMLYVLPWCVMCFYWCVVCSSLMCCVFFLDADFAHSRLLPQFFFVLFFFFIKKRSAEIRRYVLLMQQLCLWEIVAALISNCFFFWLLKNAQNAFDLGCLRNKEFRKKLNHAIATLELIVAFSQCHYICFTDAITTWRWG